MENDPTLDGKFLGKITADFIKVADFVKEASYQLRIRKITDLPIFVMGKELLPIGSLLINKGERANEWVYSVAMAEELMQKKIIDPDKKEEFAQIFKDPDEFCCLFVATDSFMNFVFVPYPEDSVTILDDTIE